MTSFLKSEYEFLDKPLTLLSRLLLVIAGALLLVSVILPLWKIRLVAPQYMEGLELHIYAYQIEGGNNGQDLVEINNLNHYIGMHSLDEADFAEMKWVPFTIGIFVLLALRAAVHGRMSQVVDLFVLLLYFGIFSIGTFYYRLYSYGHNLDPKAPMNIEPFTPILFGKNQIANFTQWSYPQSGAILLAIVPVVLFLAIWLSRKSTLAR